MKAAILRVTCDIPAGRKVCGFLGHTATLGCSKCLKAFPGGVGNKDYSGFDTTEWPKRTNEGHRNSILEIKKCKTKTKQKEEEARYGCRNSSLLELPYFDAPRMLCIDPMHNLFLGTALLYGKTKIIYREKNLKAFKNSLTQWLFNQT